MPETLHAVSVEPEPIHPQIHKVNPYHRKSASYFSNGQSKMASLLLNQSRGSNKNTIEHGIKDDLFRPVLQRRVHTRKPSQIDQDKKLANRSSIQPSPTII